MKAKKIKTFLAITSLLLLNQVAQADVIIGNGSTEIIASPTIKDLNCQNYTISSGGILDTTADGTLREVLTLTIDGSWNYGTGQILELAKWINNGTVISTPLQIGAGANIQFTTLCGAISVLGTADTDGDGISDADEGDNAVALGHGITLDQDGDGIYNFLDTDSDGDGKADNSATEGAGDVDADGIPNYLDPVNNAEDADNDGLPDDLDPNDANPDTDGDGIPDGADSDVDGDGIMDNGPDTDGDGINDNADVDVDGDGINDNGVDSDGDGINDANDIFDGRPIPTLSEWMLMLLTMLLLLVGQKEYVGLHIRKV